MQLYACLLLFIITTDKTLALSHLYCGGNVSLEQEPAGHINLTLPRNFNVTNRLNPMNHQSGKTLSLCTWIIDFPVGRTVLLKLEQLVGDSSVSVQCVWNGEDHVKVLEDGGTALLSGCGTNKTTLRWAGAGHSSNTIQLSYYVLEDERNSSQDHTSHHKTGTSFTSTAPVSQEVVKETEGVKGHLYEGMEWHPELQSMSVPSSQDQGLLHPTSPLQGLTVAGRVGRETLPLPEEGPNNGADTSGADHLTEGPISARAGTHPYFHTQHTLSTDTSNTAETETNSSDELPLTQMALTDATASISNTMPGTDIHKYTVTQTFEHVNKHTTTQDHPSVSSFSFPSIASSLPEIPSRSTWENGTDLIPSAQDVSQGEQPHSWRRQRSTDTLNSDLNSAVTSDPLKSSTEPLQDDSHSAQTNTEGTASTSTSQGSSKTLSSTTHITGDHTAVSAVTAASIQPNISWTDSFESAVSNVASQSAAFESSEKSDRTVKVYTPTSSTQSQTYYPQSTESLTHFPYTSSPFTQTSKETQTGTQSTKNDLKSHNASSSSDITQTDDQTSSLTISSSTPRTALTFGEVVHNLANTETTSETYTLHPTQTLLHENSPAIPFPSSTSIHSSTPSYTLQTHTMFPGSLHTTHSSQPLTPSTTESSVHTPFIEHRTMPKPSQSPTTKSVSSHTPHTYNDLPLPSPPNVPATHKQPHSYITTTHTSLFSLTTAKSDSGHGEREDKSWQWFASSTTTHAPTAGEPWRSAPWLTPHPSTESRLAHTPSALTFTPTWSSTTSQTPKFFIVPDQPAAIRVESVELLLQIIVEEPGSGFTAGLEEDTAVWVEPYLQKAPGFIKLLGVWSSGHAVQSLVEFKTSGALQWLSMTGATSLLEQTGLAQAVREGRSFRSSKVTNVTLGGLQGDVCDWLLQCPAGYKCVSQLGSANYSCSSICHFDYCHHHGICTHHPGQLPVCRCIVGEDFWYMGQRCDVRMTRARLVGACLAILLIMVTLIGVLALVAVRRYRAILIQAKVDQTRSSYHRFNHFDELSGRFWLRSWAGSADSMDNPAFTRSDELLHLRALDRPCCYHDDTMSLASTCPSHGARINTIYPHSSQYGWRGSEMSMADGVLDSGKASDLSVCSWPVEPIQWTPFPLLQQLASHRTPTVRVSRPRSYCEGMELVDMGKSWTA